MGVGRVNLVAEQRELQRVTGRDARTQRDGGRVAEPARLDAGQAEGGVLAREHEIAVSKIGVSAAELEAMTLAAIDAAFDDDADGYLAEMRGRVRAFYAQHAFVL